MLMINESQYLLSDVFCGFSFFLLIISSLIMQLTNMVFIPSFVSETCSRIKSTKIMFLR